MLSWGLCEMNKNDTYHSLREMCELLTDKHLPKNVFNEMIWMKLDKDDLLIESVYEMEEGYYTDIEFVYNERGAFKYKNRSRQKNSKVIRLKRSYKERASI